MNLFDSSLITFDQPAGQALLLRTGAGESPQSVFCVQLFPQSAPGRYVSVCEKTGSITREIGIISDLNALEPAQRDLVLADIRFRYFVPEITDIAKITSRRGKDTWDVETDRGKKTFIVQDRMENVSLTDTGVVFVVDIEKCRYKISPFTALPKKARTILETILP